MLTVTELTEMLIVIMNYGTVRVTEQDSNSSATALRISSL